MVIADQPKFFAHQKVRLRKLCISFKGLGFQLNFTYCLLNPIKTPLGIRKDFIQQINYLGKSIKIAIN